MYANPIQNPAEIPRVLFVIQQTLNTLKPIIPDYLYGLLELLRH